MLTQNQQTVYKWINDDLELPVYAEAYKGAIEQLNNKSSGYITFVSHAGRDLMNGLVPASEGIKRSRFSMFNSWTNSKTIGKMSGEEMDFIHQITFQMNI